MSLLLLFSLTVLVLVLIKFISWVVVYRDRLAKWRQFPGPDSLPFIGDALAFKTPADILPTGLKYMKKYGLTYRFQLGPQHMLLTGDPRLNELVTTSHLHVEKSLGITFLRNWLGEGLITADNPRWRIHRRLITPTFHFNILEEFVPIFNKNANNLIQFCKEKRMKKTFDAYEDVLLCSLDSICETAMGLSLNALQGGKQSNYVKSIKYLGEMLMTRSFSFWKQFDFLYNLSPEHKVELKMRQHMRDITNDVIKTKMEEFNKRKNANNVTDVLGRKKHAIFLDHLMSTLENNGGFMTPEQLREEVDTFIFAGHHTVASAASFVIHFLSKHQDIQQRVYEEILHVYGSNDEITFDKLAELKYLDAVIKETLRLCPAVPVHSRIAAEDIPFDGKIIPKGCHIVLFLYGAHRNEKLFNNPEKFDPDRFFDEEFTKNTLFGYIPFNAGPRNCLGQKYAMTAMKCILSKLFKEFKFAKPEGYEIQPIAEGILKSKNGIQVNIELRN